MPLRVVRCNIRITLEGNRYVQTRTYDQQDGGQGRQQDPAEQVVQQGRQEGGWECTLPDAEAPQQVAMGPHNWVKTIVRCARHNEETGPICLHVEREVEGPLRCRPGGGGGGGGVTTVTACPCGNGISVADLQRRVAEALRHGIGQWVRRGAVVIDC